MVITKVLADLVDVGLECALSGHAFDIQVSHGAGCLGKVYQIAHTFGHFDDELLARGFDVFRYNAHRIK